MKSESNELTSDQIIIAPNAVIMPAGKLLLINRGEEYGAVKFLRIWYGKTEEDWYAEYESYYLGKRNSSAEVIIHRSKLTSPRPRGIGRFSFSFGTREIKCGPFKLYWSGKGSVFFYGLNQKEGDYGIQLAPTGWSDIDDVDLGDERIKWFSYDPERRRESMSLKSFWFRVQ